MRVLQMTAENVIPLKIIKTKPTHPEFAGCMISETVPDKAILDQAKLDGKLIIYPVCMPHMMIDPHNIQLWMDGYMTGKGVERSEWIMPVCYHKGADYKLSVHKFITDSYEDLKQHYDSIIATEDKVRHETN